MFVKREYEAAIEVVPQLVENETKVVDFLRTENYNPVSAATRLALYWKYRKIIFGERWLLPMNQTGTGALSTEDIDVLKTGYKIAFQRDPSDGLMVLTDDTRLSRAPGHTNTRIMFYYATIFTDEPTQVQGATLLHVIQSGEKPDIDLQTDGWEMLRTGLAMKVKQILVVVAPHQEDQAAILQRAQQTALAEEFKSRHRAELILSDSVAATLQKLEGRGCGKPLLPSCIGGAFDYTQFAEWMRMRISVEDILSATQVSNNNRSTVSEAQADVSEEDPSLSLESTNKKRKSDGNLDPESIKKRNALYSRRMYHKRKLELLSLQEQCKVLQTRNDFLKQEATRLEGLLKRARLFVGEGGSAMPWR